MQRVEEFQPQEIHISQQEDVYRPPAVVQISRRRKVDASERNVNYELESSMSLETIRKHIDIAKYRNPSKIKLLSGSEPG